MSLVRKYLFWYLKSYKLCYTSSSLQLPKVKSEEQQPTEQGIYGYNYRNIHFTFMPRYPILTTKYKKGWTKAWYFQQLLELYLSSTEE